MIVMIPSYFGASKNESYLKRKEAHRKQLEWLLKYPVDIWILAQDYDKYEYGLHDRITYFKTSKTPVAEAKNILLEKFYSNSKYEWGLILDDDAILHPVMDGDNIIRQLINHPDKFYDVNLWWPINPAFEPFNRRYADQLDKFNLFYVFQRSSIFVKGSFFALRRDNYPVYFRGDVEAGEDVEFVAENIVKGNSCYKLLNCVLKELGSETSQKVVDDREKRREAINKTRKHIVEVYGEYGIALRSSKDPKGRVNTRFDCKELFKRYPKTQKELLVKK